MDKFSDSLLNNVLSLKGMEARHWLGEHNNELIEVVQSFPDWSEDRWCSIVLTVSKTDFDIFSIKSKEWENTMMTFVHRTIYADSGSKVSKNEALNEFLNNKLLANTVYIVDDCFLYVTDAYARVIVACCLFDSRLLNFDRSALHTPTNKKNVIPHHMTMMMRVI